MRLKYARVLTTVVFLTLALFMTFMFPVYAQEPSLEEVLNNLGFTNISEAVVETFPPGLYEIILYAEFANYHATNELSYYPVGSINYTILFSGPEGNNGYVSPPINKTFLNDKTFGFSMYVAAEDHRYFTEQSLNPDGLNHSKVYVNLDEPDMLLIGFENLYGLGDRDYNDLIFSLQPIKHYLDIKTDPPGITTIPGEGWYNHCTNVTLTAPDTVSVSECIQYVFSYWKIETYHQGNNVNPIIVHMDANHTATAYYILQYYLNVTSPYGAPGGQGWYDSGATAYASLDTDIVYHGNGTRRVFTSWSGDASGTNYSQSNPIIMNSCKTAIAEWQTQYYLTLSWDEGGVTDPSSSGWYDAETKVCVTAIPNADYVFDHWELNHLNVGSDNPYCVTMDTAHKLHAVFAPRPVGGLTVSIKSLSDTSPLLHYWITLNAALIFATLAASWVRKRKNTG